MINTSRYLKLIAMVLVAIIVSLAFTVGGYLNYSKSMKELSAYKQGAYLIDAYIGQLEDKATIFTSNYNNGESDGFEDLKTTFSAVDSLLYSLSSGGEFKKSELAFSFSEPPESLESNILSANSVWQFVKSNLGSAVGVNKPVMEEWYAEKLDRGVSQLPMSANQLKAEAGSLLKSVISAEQDAKHTLLLIIACGYLLAFASFILVALFVRGIKREDGELNVIAECQQEILDNVGEGLVLLDPEGKILPVYSESSKTIFQRATLDGHKLLDVLSGNVTEQVYEDAAEFLSMTLDPDVRDQFGDDMNPLKEVLYMMPDEIGNYSQHIIEFDLKRTLDDKGKVKRVLVTAKDVTEKHGLKKELKNAIAGSGDQLKIIAKALEMNPLDFQRFIRSSIEKLEKVNFALKDTENNNESRKASVDVIFKEVHKIKGEAGIKRISALVEIASDMETQLTELSRKDEIKGQDFIDMSVHVKRMQSLLTSYYDISSKLVDTQASASTQSFSGKPIVNANEIQRFAEEVAMEKGKAVTVHVHQSGGDLIADSEINVINDIVAQLVRNAVVHGIEPADKRGDKPSIGNIQVTIFCTEGSVQVVVEDDGAGINTEELKSKAVSAGLVSENEAAKLSEKNCYTFLFEEGISTASEVDEHAGKGMGMSAVKDLVLEHDGKIRIRSNEGEQTRFTITFPSNKKVTNDSVVG